MTRPHNVLFICTGNSARSILAEALANDPTVGRGLLCGFSAGSHPKASPNPYALELLRQEGLPVAGLRSKSWDEFAAPDAPTMDFVFTVCDQAAGEQCPYWPGHPVTAHWGLPDPAAVDGSEDEKRRAFREAFVVLKRRISLLASLIAERPDEGTLLERVRYIGRG